MSGVCVPVALEFAIGETFAPPPFLWQVNNCGVISPVNLTGFKAQFTAKCSPNSNLPPEIFATTDNGMLVINGPAGSIQLILPSSITSQLSPFEGNWDLWVFSEAYSSINTKLFGGSINVYLGVGSP